MFQVTESLTRPVTEPQLGLPSFPAGTGEYITRFSLARAICEAIMAAGDDGDTHDILSRVLETEFHSTPFSALLVSN